MIINATNIGEKLYGIGRYSLSISKFLLNHWKGPLKVQINRSAINHFREYNGDERLKIKSGIISPDNGFRGNLLRLLDSNNLINLNSKDIVFSTSQLEGSLLNRRQIVSVQDCIPFVLPAYNKKQYYFFKYVLPKVLKNALKIITCSHYSKNTIMDLYGIPEDKIEVVYYGADHINRQTNSVVQKKNYILYVGRGSSVKNLTRLISAFEIFTERHRLGTKLLLTCPPDDLPQDLVTRLGTLIECVDYVSEEKLEDLFKHALMLALPSLCEGFGFSPLEAMAQGCPALVSRAGSLPEVCGDAAFFVDPLNEESIADGIYQLATNSSMREEMIQKGLERANQFTWEKTGNQHMKILHSLM